MPIDENEGTPGPESSSAPEGNGAGPAHAGDRPDDVGEGREVGREGGPIPGAEPAAPQEPQAGAPSVSGEPAASSPEPPGPPQPLGPSIEPARRLPPPPVPRHPEARWIDLSTLVDSDTFRFRPAEEVAPLAESIARQGQRKPVDVRPVEGGYQLVSGHRRLEAVRLLHRSRILARVHTTLNDEDALYLSVSEDLDRRPWSAEERAALKVLLERRGLFSPRMSALLERAAAQAHPEALSEDEAEETGDEEVEIDEMAQNVRDRLADACNDLAVLYDMWGDLDEGRREDLVICVRYLKDMYPFLEASEDES